MASTGRYPAVLHRSRTLCVSLLVSLAAALGCSRPTVEDATQASAQRATARDEPALDPLREEDGLDPATAAKVNEERSKAQADWLSLLRAPGGGILQLPVRDGLDLVPADAVAWVVVRDARVVVYAAKRLLQAIGTGEEAAQPPSDAEAPDATATGGSESWFDTMMLAARDRGSAASLLALLNRLDLQPGRGVMLSVARDSWVVLVPLEDLGAIAPFALLAGMTNTAVRDRCAVASDVLGYVACSPTPGVAAKYRPGRMADARVKALGTTVAEQMSSAAVIAGLGAGPAEVTGPMALSLELGEHSMTLVTEFTPPSWLTAIVEGDRVGRTLADLVQPGDAVLLATRISPKLLAQLGAPLSTIAATLSGDMMVGTVAGHQALAIGIDDPASLRTALTFASFAAGNQPIEMSWPVQLSVSMRYDSISTTAGSVERLHLELGGLEASFAMLGDAVAPNVDILIFDRVAIALFAVPQQRLQEIATRVMAPPDGVQSGLDEGLLARIDEGRVVAFSQLDLGVLGSATSRTRALEAATAGLDEDKRRRIAALLELTAQLCGGVGQTSVSLEIVERAWVIRSKSQWRAPTLTNANVGEELEATRRELQAAADLQLAWLTSALRLVVELVPQ